MKMLTRSNFCEDPRPSAARTVARTDVYSSAFFACLLPRIQIDRRGVPCPLSPAPQRFSLSRGPE
eukprot:6536091-Pyramimonas_sp.AAC.1